MNSLNLTQLAGLPLTQTDVKWLQDTYSAAFSAMASVIGDKVIVSGMVESSGTVTNGWISLNGELIPFIGGTIGTGEFDILETVTNRTFKDGTSKPVRIDRVAILSITGVYQYSDLKRIGYLKEMWQEGDIKQMSCDAAYIAANFDVTGKGTNKRIGWAICNGQNGTADLRGKFLVGYDPAEAEYDEPGKIGGENEHTLTVDEMPPHKHTFAEIGDKDTDPVTTYRLVASNSDGAVGLTIDGKMNNTGGGLPHENRPPFYTVLFIQKLS